MISPREKDERTITPGLDVDQLSKFNENEAYIPVDIKACVKSVKLKILFIIIRSFLKSQNSCLKRKVLRWQGCNLIIVFYSLFFLEAEDNVSFFTKFGGNLELIFK